MHTDAFRRCLIDLDIVGIQRLWKHVSPHLPQPKTELETLVALHYGRTCASSVPEDLRLYSHMWLIDRGWPSALPDILKPKAERMYPKVVETVGISVNVRSELLKPLVVPVRTAMENAVLEAFADKKTNSDHVKERMFEARRQTIKKLMGIELNK